MRHIGRVHRVSVQWLHERIGKHPDNDGTLLFYDDTHDMSADMCTKLCSAPDKCDRALHLINVFHADELTDEFLSDWVLSRLHHARSDESTRMKEPIVSKGGHRREVQRAKSKPLASKARNAGAPSVAVSRDHPQLELHEDGVGTEGSDLMQRHLGGGRYGLAHWIDLHMSMRTQQAFFASDFYQFPCSLRTSSATTGFCRTDTPIVRRIQRSGTAMRCCSTVEVRG